MSIFQSNINIFELYVALFIKLPPLPNYDAKVRLHYLIYGDPPSNSFVIFLPLKSYFFPLLSYFFPLISYFLPLISLNSLSYEDNGLFSEELLKMGDYY